MTVKEWRKRHKRCKFCAYCYKAMESTYYDDALCTAKDRAVTSWRDGKLCRVFKLKEVPVNDN